MVGLGRDCDRVHTIGLSRSQDLPPSSIAEVLNKLDDQGFGDYVPYRGIGLTPRGEAEAAKRLGPPSTSHIR